MPEKCRTPQRFLNGTICGLAIAGCTAAIFLVLSTAAWPAAKVAMNSATCERIANGYRLANDKFEAVLSIAEPTIGVTRLSHRGAPRRQEIEVTELPITLRLATDAPRIDILNWSFHAGSGTALPPETEWGIQLGLHKSPVDNNGGPRASA